MDGEHNYSHLYGEQGRRSDTRTTSLGGSVLLVFCNILEGKKWGVAPVFFSQLDLWLMKL